MQVYLYKKNILEFIKICFKVLYSRGVDITHPIAWFR